MCLSVRPPAALAMTVAKFFWCVAAVQFVYHARWRSYVFCRPGRAITMVAPDSNYEPQQFIEFPFLKGTK